jgi:hypothetical protein
MFRNDLIASYSNHKDFIELDEKKSGRIKTNLETAKFLD